MSTAALDPAKRQFVSLELGRFCAAAAVAAFHGESALRNLLGRYVGDDTFRWGHAGVEYFFVLSGFVMFWTNESDKANWRKAGTFLKRRAIRILPSYWFAFLCMAAAFLLAPALLQGRAFTVWDQIRDFLLIPRSGEMLMNVAWTLRQEALFYLLFAVCLLTSTFRFYRFSFGKYW